MRWATQSADFFLPAGSDRNGDIGIAAHRRPPALSDLRAVSLGIVGVRWSREWQCGVDDVSEHGDQRLDGNFDSVAEGSPAKLVFPEVHTHV